MRAELPIITDDEPKTAQEIVLGNNRHLSDLATPVDTTALGEEGQGRLANRVT